MVGKEIMSEQLKRLYDSFCQIGDVEKIKTTFDIDVTRLKGIIAENQKQIDKHRMEMSVQVSENQDLKEILKETVNMKNKLQEDKEKILSFMKEKLNAADTDLNQERKQKEEL